MASRLSYPYATDLDRKPKKKDSPNAARSSVTQLPAVPSATPPPTAPEPPQYPATNGYVGGRNSPAGIRASAEALESDVKMRVLESRLGMTEKSNKSLLEEVCRLQNELRMTVTRNEQAIYDEKQARMQLDAALHKVSDVINQLTARVSGAENKLIEEKSALSTLVGHTKGVEQAIVASQEEMQTKRDAHRNKLLDLQSKIVETQRAKEQLEKTVYGLMDETRALRHKMESQQGEFNTVITDLRLHSRRLEEENKIQLNTLRKQGDIQSHTDQNTTYLRGQVEARLAELRDVILDLRGRQDTEINERRTLEQLLHQKVSELNMALGEQNRKRDEAIHSMDMAQKERERAAETEKLRVQNKLAESMEEMNKRLVTKEQRLREDMQEKTHQLEKAIQKETEKSVEYKQKMQDENEAKWAAVKKQMDDDVRAVREEIKKHGVTKEALQKLDESISLLEKQLGEQKRQYDKVITAEIQSRKEHEQRTQESLKHVHEKLQVATSTLQQAISTATEQINGMEARIREDMKSMLAASEEGTTRAMTDMDVCLKNMKVKVDSLESMLDSSIVERVNLYLNSEAVELNQGTAELAQSLREQVATLIEWQEGADQRVKVMDQSIRKVPVDIAAVEGKQAQLKTEIEARITTEEESRTRDVQNLEKKIAALGEGDNSGAATKEDLQEVQEKVRKLAESVQTVKTMLALKIQSEQKARLGDTKRLEEDIEEINKKIKPLLKDDGDDDDDDNEGDQGNR